MENICCRNCGEKGHMFKNCPKPITSYGILCFHKNSSNKIKYLMIKKRHTFAYIEFLRSKYDLLDPVYIQSMFNHMTVFERELITNNKFNYLWNKLWLIKKNTKVTNPNLKGDFYKGVIKFNILQNGYVSDVDGKYYKLSLFIQNCTKNYKYPEWFFPKGRQNSNETNIESAIREFEEETNIPAENISIYEEIDPIEEIHIGSNGVKYKTIFYVAKYNKNAVTEFVKQNRNKYQKHEIDALEWFTKDECLNHFRDYENEKRNLFIKASSVIEKL